MMKRKVKRFNEGGEAELKKRGLEESKNERVGFFERLRMGNIDKPGSEAYEKFGAGRGRAAETAQRESEAAKSGPLGVKSEYTGTRFGQPEVKAEDKRVDEEPSRKTSGPFSNVEAAVKSATSRDTESSAPAPVKKAMKVAEKAEPKKAAPAEKKETPSRMTIAKETMEKGRAGSDEAPKKKETPKFAPVTRTRAGTPVATRKEPTEAEKESGRKFSEEKLKKQKEDFENTPFMRMLRGAGGRSEYYKKKADAERQGYGMKKGGSVSSASKRADGIAQRGKTRGRIC